MHRGNVVIKGTRKRRVRRHHLAAKKWAKMMMATFPSFPAGDSGVIVDNTATAASDRAPGTALEVATFRMVGDQ
ncbi:hypothetical protein [Rubripirellula amarantea]|nr:hypothetical protein [Rubripirellula amarantea]